MLMYTAEMKNPVRESLATKKAKVALVLEQLALTSCRNVKIGNALDRGISGSSHESHIAISGDNGTALFGCRRAPGQHLGQGGPAFGTAGAHHLWQREDWVRP